MLIADPVVFTSTPATLPANKLSDTSSASTFSTTSSYPVTTTSSREEESSSKVKYNCSSLVMVKLIDLYPTKEIFKTSPFLASMANSPSKLVEVPVLEP